MMSHSRLLALSFFGKIEAPPGVEQYNNGTGAIGGIGLLVFVSNVMKAGTVVAGLWVMVNIILAGFTYITESGESNTLNKAKDQITSSIVGLAIIVAAWTITALISYFFFGDPLYILSPDIQGPK
jgi:hypothetical protein